jgi:Type VI secretion system (T6SS), amidase effector protein 4
MESFVDAHGQPVSRIDLAVGETKIVGLSKYNLIPHPEVGVVVQNSSIAFSHQCVHLGDPTKKKYIDVYDMAEVAQGNVPIEVGGKFYFQLCGRAAGHTQIDAFRWISPQKKIGSPYAPIVPYDAPAEYAPYARSLTITVTDEKPKLLIPPPASGKAVGSFETMWQNHPCNPTNGPVEYPCNEGRAPLGHMQCFVRLCEALHKSGVSFRGCIGSSCQLKGAGHAHHFSNPYDFPNWLWAKGKAYVWQAKRPFAPEPMPGLAAFEFVQQRQGIVLFTHYFDVGKTSMWGGHIDLWNKGRMGNTYSDRRPEQGEAAFLRSERISFWPLK